MIQTPPQQIDDLKRLKNSKKVFDFLCVRYKISA
jgi:hypothetical protein